MSLYQIARTETGKVISLNAKMANRHGLIAGATGTGKTVTLRKLAESLSDDGVPVFLVDVKVIFRARYKRVIFQEKLQNAFYSLI